MGSSRGPRAVRSEVIDDSSACPEFRLCLWGALRQEDSPMAYGARLKACWVQPRLNPSLRRFCFWQ